MKTISCRVILVILLIPVFQTAFSQNFVNVKNINIAAGSYPRDFTIVNNKMFFIAQAYGMASELWVTEGTDASTQMLSPALTFFGIADIVAYNGKIYFSYNDGGATGQELWVSDGTAAGTVLFKDLYPGSEGSFPDAFTVANNKLFFRARNADGDKRLYVSDGTPAGTVLLKDTALELFNGMADFAVLDNDIYFTSDGGINYPYGLWKSDGTPGGTVLIRPGISSTFGTNYVVFNNKLYFGSSDWDNVYGGELWVSDGTTAGTHVVKDLVTGEQSGQPNNLNLYNNKIYFTASDDTHGPELFVSDGTAAGTVLVKDIVPGAEGSAPLRSMVYNGALYFSCSQSAAAGLWKSDGTDAGTVLVKSGGGAEPWLNILEMGAVWNNILYFVVKDLQYYPFWQTDGTAAGTKPVQLQNTVSPAFSYSPTFQFKEFNAELYFSGKCGTISDDFDLAKLTSGVLPLHLISFTGQAKDGKDILLWETANEINTDQFSIEQSFDGKVFFKAGVVKAAGNSAANLHYSYTQSSTLNPGGFYRLRMVDIDGKYTYSPVIKLNRTSKRSITAAYSAATKQISINNYAQVTCNWQLISINGGLIRKSVSADAVIHLSTDGISGGMYVLVCTSSSEIKTIKMVIY